MTEDGGHAECGLESLECFVGAGAPGQGLGLPAEQGGKRAVRNP